MRGYFLKGTLELILSLILAGVIALPLGKNLRKNAKIWYIVGWIVSLGTLAFGILTRLDIISVSPRAQWVRIIRAVLSGYLPAALFIYVMWAGALPKGNEIMKKLMGVRSEMSILGTILYLPHALFYGAFSLPHLVGMLVDGDVIISMQIMGWSGLINTILLLILGITSAKSVRKKMSGKKWKSLQKWAYLFYFLTYVHSMSLAVGSYNERAVIYTVIFGAYLAARLKKAHDKKKRTLSRAA
ncbi:MAG: hypothetical protein PQJ60_03530 [Spirochaetales bacterium]|nr:hypothetical protein [Spirochaetales bacterium]